MGVALLRVGVVEVPVSQRDFFSPLLGVGVSLAVVLTGVEESVSVNGVPTGPHLLVEGIGVSPTSGVAS